jgi:hypothetical protein
MPDRRMSVMFDGGMGFVSVAAAMYANVTWVAGAVWVAYRVGWYWRSRMDQRPKRFDAALQRLIANAVIPPEYEDYYLVRRTDFHEMEAALADAD